MTQFLPPNLLALFAPRDPIPYLPPVDKLPYEKKTAGYSGVSDFLQLFEDPKLKPLPARIETREERQERKRKEKAEQVAYRLEQDIALWAPHDNPNATTDAYRTLFIARINYDTSESKLRREFEQYGPIKKINVVHHAESGKPRGYAFIEYEYERDMHSAYKHADGKKIDGRRVLVDVERARTVKGWLPRRLGGGLGGTRRGGPEVNVKHSGREDTRGDDRYMDRDRIERPERRRSRSRSRERRRRSRSRERHRTDRHKRDRSRDRERGRDREPFAAEKGDMGDMLNDVPPDVDRKERRRSRSRDRGDKSDRDKSERGDRDKAERGDRGDKAERGDRDKTERGDRGDKAERGDRDKADRGDRDKAERGDKGDRDRPDRDRRRRRSRSRDRKRRDRDDRDRDMRRQSDRNMGDRDDRIGLKDEPPIKIKEEKMSPIHNEDNGNQDGYNNSNYDETVEYKYNPDNSNSNYGMY